MFDKPLSSEVYSTFLGDRAAVRDGVILSAQGMK